MPSKVIISGQAKPSAIISHSDLTSSITYANLSAESSLDPDSQHKFLRDGHTVSFTDSQTFTFGKGLSDDFSFSDQPAFDFGKGVSDSFGFSDSQLIQITFFRTFTDAFTLDDSAQVDAFRKDVGAQKSNIFQFSDEQTIGFGKGVSDSVALSESSALGLSKALADSTAITESLSKVVSYVRTFNDSQGFSDEIDDFDVEKGVTDTISLVEDADISFSLVKADSTNMADAPAVGFSKAAADDAFTLSESLTRTVSFVRTFTDAFTLDDAAVVDAFVRDSDLGKTNVFSFSDSQSFGVEKALADSFAPTEALDSISFEKGLSDSATMTENFSFVLFSNAAMNAATLNFSPFNE